MKRKFWVEDVLKHFPDCDSITEVCKKLGISRAGFHARLTRMSIEEAIALPVEKHGRVASCDDGMGNTFPSVVEMLHHYHMSQSMFYARLRKGMTVKEALTAPRMS